MIDLFNYHRRKTSVVHVGTLGIGGDNPVRLQSMTTTSTDDTDASVAQAERIIKAGGELVRLTTQGVREAENLKNIRDGLSHDGFPQPIVADVHFNARVADVAALYAEGVRINPGNYVDPARRFIQHEYTDEEYAAELQKIEERLVPLLDICRQHHTALRIGVNHGSLSDRIRNRYGDTPEGIVESCMEFLRICKRHGFDNVVISIKASNTVIMVRSVRLLVETMDREDVHYPLHLGVTEAGEGEDGRIKSAVGIGALLADGIGDTIRVSLTEEPEAEIPVARMLADHFSNREGHLFVPGKAFSGFSWTHPERRRTTAVGNIGGSNTPVVIVSAGQGSSAAPSSAAADYVYVGQQLPGHPASGQKYIVDFQLYAQLQQDDSPLDAYPIFPAAAMPFIGMVQAPLKFLVLQFGTPADEYLACLRAHPEVVVVCSTPQTPSGKANPVGWHRALIHEMMDAGVRNPVVFAGMYQTHDKEKLQLEAAADMGALMVDGLVDGLWLMNAPAETALAILQAGRLRMSRTEFISCPGCGRTLYNLQDTVRRIREAFAQAEAQGGAKDRMQNLKIAIMGCIVNGPGEMADADYGYVGAGPGKISLYRGKECVEHNIPDADAVAHLLRLINADLAKARQ